MCSYCEVLLYILVLFSLMLLSVSMICAHRGGVLTYLLPTTYDFTEQDLPVHPCLQLTQVSESYLSVCCLYYSTELSGAV